MKTSVLVAIPFAISVPFTICAAAAQTLMPIEASAIDLGAAHGTAYYVPEAGGYRVVATLDSGSGAPVRFDTTLMNGQTVRLSVPGAVGEPDVEMTFSRISDRMEVHRSNPMTDAVTASTR